MHVPICYFLFETRKSQTQLKFGSYITIRIVILCADFLILDKFKSLITFVLLNRITAVNFLVTHTTEISLAVVG